MSGAPMIFDRALIRARQDRARRLGPVTFLLERVTQDLAERLGAVVRHFEVAVDLGTPTADLRRALANNPAIGLLIAASSNAQSAGLALVANEEALPFADASLDLVVSALALQTDDLPGTLVQIRRAPKPDGLLLAAPLATRCASCQSLAAAESEIEGGLPRVPFRTYARSERCCSVPGLRFR